MNNPENGGVVLKPETIICAIRKWENGEEMIDFRSASHTEGAAKIQTTLADEDDPWRKTKYPVLRYANFKLIEIPMPAPFQGPLPARRKRPTNKKATPATIEPKI